MTLMQRRRALMGAKKAGAVIPTIPTEYQRVEYVAVDDYNGYADTGINVSLGYVIWIDAQFRKLKNAAGILGFVMSSLTGGNYKTWEINWLVGSQTVIVATVYTSRLSARIAGIECEQTARHLFVLNSKDNLFIIDNDSDNLDFSGFVPTKTLKLGKAHDVDGGAMPIIWMAGYKKPDGTEHFAIPCYRKTDAVTGVFCTETQTFHEFSGATTKGPDVT